MLLKKFLIYKIFSKILSDAQNNYKNAINLLKEAEAIKVKPQDELLYVAFGVAYYFKDRNDLAKHNLKLAQKINRNNRAVDEYLNLLNDHKKTINHHDILLRENYFSNPIIHDTGHDRILDIVLDKFYCKPGDPRVDRQ